MTKIFTAIERSKKRILTKRIIFFSVILVILLGIIYIDKIEKEGLFTKIYLFIFLAWVFLNIVSNFFISSYKIKGNVTFSDETIELPKLKAKINQIELLKINVNNYKGEHHKGMFVGIGAAAPKEGINNTISLNLKYHYKVNYEFLIDYKQDIEILKRALLYYKQKGLNVSYIYKGRTVI